MIFTSFQFTILFMLLMHLVADYTLQGWLADGKQMSWWKRQFGGFEDSIVPKKYRYDYIAALVCHSLYWSILICIPFYASPIVWVAVLVNTVVHAIVDDLKANRKKLNLIEDQLIHAVQIVGTALVFFI